MSESAGILNVITQSKRVVEYILERCFIILVRGPYYYDLTLFFDICMFWD